MTDTTAPADTSTIEKKETCPRCHFNLSEDNTPAPSEDEKKEYVRCLLSGKVFSKTYGLFDGQITARFDMLTSAEADRMKKALLTVSSDEAVSSITDSIKIKCLYYCREFNGNVFNLDFDPEKWEDEHAKRFGEMGEDIPVIITRVLLEFLRLAESLPAAGLDKSFYKGAGLA